jgi:hypothetical protein
MANFNIQKFSNYENPYQVREYVNTILVPHIYEMLCDEYGFTSEDYDINDINDHVVEIIDGLSDVIYNYQAKKIAETFYYDPFTSESEMTGEKFNSYNEMAFELLYNKFYDVYSEQLIY